MEERHNGVRNRAEKPMDHYSDILGIQDRAEAKLLYDAFRQYMYRVEESIKSSTAL